MNLQLRIAKLSFGAKARRRFYLDFAAALQDGAEEKVHLERVAARAKDRGQATAKMFDYWLHRMKRVSFAKAMQGFIPDSELMILTAAQEDNSLANSMIFLAQQIKDQGVLIGMYVAGLLSPSIAGLAFIAYLIAYKLYMAPSYLQMVPVDNFPPLNKLMLITSTFIVEHWFMAITGFLLTFSLIAWSRQNWTGPIRSKADRIWLTPWRGYKKKESVRFLVTLGILLRGNQLGPKECLERMREMANPWLRYYIAKMISKLILTPKQPAKALDINFFERALMDRIEDSADRSSFYQALTGIAFDRREEMLEEEKARVAVTVVIALLFFAVLITLVSLASLEIQSAIEASISKYR